MAQTYCVVCFGIPAERAYETFINEALSDALRNNGTSKLQVKFYEDRQKPELKVGSIILPAEDATKLVAAKTHTYDGITLRFSPSKTMQEALGSASSGMNVDQASSRPQTNGSANVRQERAVKFDTGRNEEYSRSQPLPAAPPVNNHIEAPKALFHVGDVVAITHVDTEESIFYATSLANRDTLHEIQDNVERIANASTANAAFSPEIGTLVVALSAAYGTWFRGFVVEKQGASFKVYYPDFGNSEVLKSANLRPVPVNDAKLTAAAKVVQGHEPVAVECSFAGKPDAVKNGISNLSRMFSAESFGDLEWTVSGVFLSASREVHLLQLTSENGGKRYSLPQNVMNAADIVSLDNVALLKRMEAGDAPQEKMVEVHPRNGDGGGMRNGTHAVDDRSSVSSRSAGGSLQNGTSSVVRNGAPPTSTQNGHRDSAPTLLFKGDAVVITHIDEEAGGFCVLPLNKKDRLEEMQDFVTQISVTPRPPPSFMPEIRSRVVALSEEFRMWFRATVLAKEGDHVIVCFDDFGNKEKVPVINIRPLPKNEPRFANAVKEINSSPLVIFCSFPGQQAAVASGIKKLKASIPADVLIDLEWKVEDVKLSSNSETHLVKMTTTLKKQPFTVPDAVMDKVDVVDSHVTIVPKAPQPQRNGPSVPAAAIGASLEERVAYLEGRVAYLEGIIRDRLHAS